MYVKLLLIEKIFILSYKLYRKIKKNESHYMIAGSKTCGPQKLFLPDIKHIIAVGSGKGGVGKSTLSVNLALGLLQSGLKVGLLDADIYGPSLPLLMDIKEKPKTDGKFIQPIEKYGLKTMSIGYMVPEDKAIIWRGLMVSNALKQMITTTAWGQLDVLVIDLPPGTGDVQLTLVQQLKLSGAVIITTPQDLALVDARKAIEMFKKVNTPIIGLVENMSYFQCTQCDHKHYIFNQEGGKKEANHLNLSFLGEIPLNIHIRQACDQGKPFMICEENAAIKKNYQTISQAIKNFLLETK